MSLDQVLETIKETSKTANRSVDEIHLVAVSKLQPPEKIRALYERGIRDFGENYVQELLEKKEQLKDLKDIHWHLIGPLQTNKVKQVISHIDYFHALDSLKLANEIQKRAEQISKVLSVFIQVNIDEEPSKKGIDLGGLAGLASSILKLKNINLIGLMCIPDPLKDTNMAFLRLKNIAQKLSSELSVDLQLSMGMSGDYPRAIECGANWIRVGSLLFGPRPASF
ncbi:MAG: YggS family pyridoxal phosphate-dependent enzyme [Bacteriovoracia bacterium]